MAGIAAEGFVGAALAAICLKFAAKAAPTVRRFVQIWVWDNLG
jgi:hypothetical protein